LAEIGPRMVLNPIKIFDGSFTGQTLWENPSYVTPNAKRSMLKKLKSTKYVEKVQARAAHEAGKPTESTYKVDETEDVFQTIVNENGKEEAPPAKHRNNNNSLKKKKKKNKKKKSAAVVA
jgi:ribosome biogenesis protein BRX1